MPEYSISVAIFDFFPVLATAIGLFLLAGGIAHRHKALASVAWAAAVLIPLGGACKASWKLIVAMTQQPIGWLENLLFILMAPGFVAMAFCLFHARRAWQAGIAPDQADYPRMRLGLWLVAVLGGARIAAILSPDARLWFIWLLAVTTLATLSLLVQATLAARWAGLGNWVTAYFVYGLVATLAMGGLARLPDTEASAWIQEAVNLSGQAILAIGFWQLSRRMQQDR